MYDIDLGKHYIEEKEKEDNSCTKYLWLHYSKRVNVREVYKDHRRRINML